MTVAELEEAARAAGLELRPGSAAEMAAAHAKLKELAEQARKPLA